MYLLKRTAAMSFYAVHSGRIPGIYSTWAECEAQVKGFAKARYKKFNSEIDARTFVNEGQPGFAAGISGKQTVQTSSGVPSFTAPQPIKRDPRQFQGIHVEPDSTKPKTVLSSSRVIALKGTIQNVKSTVEQLRTYVSQAEEQLEALQKGKKRLQTETGPSSGGEGAPPQQKRRVSGMSEPTEGEEVCVYTDGCCHNNGRENAQAGIGVYWGPGHPLNVSERLSGRPTNNRAEIHAAIHAIRQAKQQGHTALRIYTDSAFLINSITKWIKKWKKNGWKLASGDPVVNREDFEELDAELPGINVTWVHVRGHEGIHGNEEADRLANEGARQPSFK